MEVLFEIHSEAGALVFGPTLARASGRAARLTLKEAAPREGRRLACAPDTDADLLVAHHHRLYAFAHTHAPELLKTLGAAWQSMGETPMALWG